MTDYAEDQEMEVEALQSILMDDMAVVTGSEAIDGASHAPCYQISVSPLGDGEETDPDGDALRGDKVAAADVEENGAGDTNGVVAEDVDDCLIVDDEDEVKAANVAAGTKRKRDDDDDDRDAKEIRIE